MALTRDHIEISKRIDEFSTYLRKKGLKLTSQRLLVGRKIFSMASHFTVDHLADALRDRRDKISRATIYRIVSVMVEGGLLIEHDFGKNAKFYEHVYEQEHHDHVICLDCGHIEEFYNDKIEQIQIEVAMRLDFELRNHSLNLYGSCRKMKNKGICPNMKAKNPVESN